jgi:pimeloyl-ACP methyl ester carboxylesterase
MSRRWVAVLATAAVLLTVTMPAALARPKFRVRGAMRCADAFDGTTRFSLPVNGEQATGFYALPSARPVGIVVFSHGYGHSSYSWRHHLRRVAEELHVITVAMDGRGLDVVGMKASGVPDTRGWPVQAAAEDGIAAARYFQAKCPDAKTVVNYGVSMGGNTAGIMAATPVTRAAGRTPLFDYWVDIEGATSMIETYLTARTLGPVNGTAKNAAEDIERETGGPIEEHQDAYAQRNVLTRAQDIKASGVRGVVLVQGVDDGLVPYNQSQEMRTALQAVGLPTQYFTVTLKSDDSERETTLTGAALGNVQADYRSPFAGHTSEMSTTHLVSLTGFERLAAIFEGAPPLCTQEYVVDGQAGTTPAPSSC